MIFWSIHVLFISYLCLIYYIWLSLLLSHRSDADKVEDILDELEEEKEIHNAISDAISRPANDLYDDVSKLFYPLRMFNDHMYEVLRLIQFLEYLHF